MRGIARLLFVALVFAPGAASPQGGNPLGPEFRVNTYTTGSQDEPAVASDPSGNFVVVWASHTNNDDVFGQRYDSTGGPLGPQFRVNTYTTGNQRRPAVTSDASGNFVIMWQSLFFELQKGVFGQRYASTGEPLGPEFQVNNVTANQRTPAVTSDASGNFVVIWESYSLFTSFGIFGQRYASTGGLLGPAFTVTTGGAHPAVASDASGNFLVVWTSYSQDGAGRGVLGQRYASTGAPLGPEFRVNTYTTDDQSLPAVASDLSGNFFVVWESDFQDGSQYGVFGQRYASTGAPLGPEFRVNTYTTSYQFNPAVASDSSGNFVVVWQSSYQDGSYRGVLGQRYDSTGTPLGPEFRVNTYTTGSQHDATAASDPSGSFIVVWVSSDQDGDSGGVFGQRYRAIVPVALTHFEVE